MRECIILLLSCASVYGADGGIQVFTTAKTNAETASIVTKDIYTRDGQTNLVRHTATKGGVVRIRMHRFYHAGSLVADYIAMPDSVGFITEAGTPYSVSLESEGDRTPKSVVLGTKDGVVLDAFSYTNGVFSPVGHSVIQKANAVGAEMRVLFDPEHVRESTPEEFVRDAQELIEKHQDE